VIRVRNLAKSYGDVHALTDVSFDVQPGEVFGLLGANGSGKSTLNRCLATLIRPGAGSLEVAGCDPVTDPDGVRQAIGYLPEHPVVYPSLSAEEFLRFIGGVRGMAAGVVTERIDRWLDLFELQAARNLPLGGYSQGMGRKVALAAALLSEPPVVLLDEPTNGLDPPSVYLFRQVIASLRAQGRTVLLSSHVLPLVQQACDRLGVLHDGKLVAAGTLDELRDAAGKPRADLEELFLSFSGLDRVMLDRLADAGLGTSTKRSPGTEDRR
jgi:ABC-2 type transport system ATP-binding protein